MVLALPVAVALLVVQDPGGERAQLAGRVIGSDGEPIADARVVLLHRPIPRSVDAGTSHRQEVVTDGRGMYRASCWADCAYSVWARWPTGATAIAEGVINGGFVELRQDVRCEPRSFALEFAAGWDAFEPLTLRIVAGGENVDYIPIPRHGNEFTIPALPAYTGRCIEILGGPLNEVLWALRIDPDSPLGDAFALPPMTTVDVEVVDEAGGPVAGAEIRRHLLNYWFTTSPAWGPGERFLSLWPLVGTTDGEGHATLTFPRASADDGCQLLATAPGRRMSISGWVQEGPVQDNATCTSHGDRVRFTLATAPAAPTPLSVGGIRYSGPVHVVWRNRVKTDTGARGCPVVLPPLQAVDGVVHMPACPDRWTIDQAWIVLPEPARQNLAELGATPPRAYRIAETGAEQLRAPPFAADTHTRLQITRADGRPAAQAVVLSAEIASTGPQKQQAYRADRLGRVLLPRASKPKSLVIVAEQDWWAGHVTLSNEPQPISLVPQPAVSGRVVDAEGQPAVGIVIRATPSRHSASMSDPGVHPAMSYRFLHGGQDVVSGADGTFRFPYLPWSGDYFLRAGAGSPESFDATPGASPEPLILTLPPR